jgi:hypothetical protein
MASLIIFSKGDPDPYIDPHAPPPDSLLVYKAKFPISNHNPQLVKTDTKGIE